MERLADLAVDGQHDTLGSGGQREPVLKIGRSTRGLLMRVCGEIGVITKRLQVLLQDRASGGEAVGGRSDGSADDQAVGAVCGDGDPADRECDIDHRQRAAG